MMQILKKHFLSCLFLLLFIVATQSVQAQTDRVEGLWYNDAKTAKVQITKAANGKFNGKIVWLKEPSENGKPRTDQLNPDEHLRNKPLLGLKILSDLEKDGDDKYVDGKIYDPKNGKTYSCKMTYKGKTLDIRGYIGISLIGRTTVWERAN